MLGHSVVQSSGQTPDFSNSQVTSTAVLSQHPLKILNKLAADPAGTRPVGARTPLPRRESREGKGATGFFVILPGRISKFPRRLCEPACPIDCQGVHQVPATPVS